MSAFSVLIEFSLNFKDSLILYLYYWKYRIIFKIRGDNDKL